MTRALWILPAALLLAGCGSANKPFAECPNLTGLYRLDPAECHTNGGKTKAKVDVARFPDGSEIPARPIYLAITQAGCSAIAFATLPINENDTRPLHSWTVAAGKDGKWDEGALTGSDMERNRTPVTVGGEQGYYWRLTKDTSSGMLTYASGYREHGLFILMIPYDDRREMTCTLVPK